MKYIRTYDDYESYKAEYSDTSRGFRLKPTLYKYSEAGDHVQLELDDPRKHGDSTYMEITLDSDVEFSFYIGNAPDDTQTTMNCSIDWGDGTVETKTITEEIINDDKGFKLSHNYKAGSYEIELYDVERDYGTVGGTQYQGWFTSPISHPSAIKRVVLGGSIVSIGKSMFAYCSSLTSVYIPESVTSIGEGAFDYCNSLKSINIPESVTSIEYSVFHGCTGLTSIYIPESVTSIGDSAFANCTSLTSVYIPKSVTSIVGFFGCTGLTSIYIPESVTSIGTSAFHGCTGLTSIYIPESVTSIRDSAFHGCTGLTSINIPESVTSISGFNGCTGLASIRIPEKVTSIGVYAFDGCTGLTSIRIPERVTSIEAWAFRGCTSLTSISSLNNTAPTLGRNLFERLPKNGTLHIKPGATGYDAWLSQLPSGWTIVEDL